MTAIADFLKAEIKKADGLVDKALARASEIQVARNKQRKDKRVAESKKPRQRQPKIGKEPAPLPERAYAYKAYARLKICEYLLKQIARLEAGEVEQVLVEAAKGRAHYFSYRQNAKLKAYWQDCIEELRASLSRLKAAVPAADVENWNEGKIQAMLELRVKALEQGLPILDQYTLDDRIVATLYLREYARLLVARRFHTSHHLRDAKRLNQVAPVIKLEPQPELVKAYGEIGKNAWREAVDDFVREMLIIHGLVS